MKTKVQCATNVYNAVRVFNIATLSLSRNRSISTTLHYLCTVFGLFHKIHAQVTFVLTHRHAMRSIVHVPPPHRDASSDHVTKSTPRGLPCRRSPRLGYTPPPCTQRQTPARTGHTSPLNVSAAQRRPLWRVLWRVYK